MGNHEKGTKTSPPPPSYFLRERHLPPALGEAMVVYFEWCAIMTVQQINVTQVCGKRWNFRVIPCKLLILSGEVATQRHAAHLLHTPTWQLYCCAKTFDSLLYFRFVKKTLGLSESQIQKLIWDHCCISCTSSLMVAWLDCMAIKHSEALSPTGCLIYTVCILACCTRSFPIVSYIMCLNNLRDYSFGTFIGRRTLRVRESWYENMVTEKYKNDSLTAHNHFKTRNRSTATAEVYLPFLSPVLRASAPSPPLGGQCKDHEVKQNQSGTHITLCLPPFSSPGGWQGLSGLTWVESDSNCHLHRQGSAAFLEAGAKYT